MKNIKKVVLFVLAIVVSSTVGSCRFSFELLDLEGTDSATNSEADTDTDTETDTDTDIDTDTNADTDTDTDTDIDTDTNADTDTDTDADADTDTDTDADADTDTDTDGAFCPGAVAPTDDFEDAVIDSQWTCEDFSGSSITEAGGVLTFAFANGIPRDTWAGCRIDVGTITGRQVTVEIDDIQASSDAWVYFKIQNSTHTQWVEMNRSYDEMNARTLFSTGFGNSASEPYSNATHRFWRLREASGTIHFEVSADGTTFGTLTTSPTTAVDLSAAEIAIGVYAWKPAVKTPGSAGFGSLCVQ